MHKAFADFTAVREVSLTIEDGEFFVLLGPSGCGKTTTLRMIAGLELPTSGEIRLGGEDVTFLRARERDIAFVFQLFALYPHMNVRQNIGFPLKCIGMPRAEIRQRVEEAARLLRIDHLLGQRVSRLAGGDRQRVALGRAIVRRPKAFLMDEPLGTLDAAFRELMCEELKASTSGSAPPPSTSPTTRSRPWRWPTGSPSWTRGSVLQAGTPAEIYHRPRSMFVAAFIGSPSMSFLACEGKVGRGASAVALCGTSIAVPQLHADVPQDRLVLGVRPEHVRLDDASPIRGEVFGVEYMGARQILTIDTEAGRLRLRAPNQVRAEIGELVGLAFQPDRLLLFDPATERALASDLVPEAPAMAEVRLEGVVKRYRRGHGGGRPRPHAARRRARGPAGPDRCRQDHDAAPRGRPGASGRRPGLDRRPRRQHGSSPPAATWPSSSRRSRSIRTTPSSTIWPSPCARRCAACRKPRSPPG